MEKNEGENTRGRRKRGNGERNERLKGWKKTTWRGRKGGAVSKAVGNGEYIKGSSDCAIVWVNLLCDVAWVLELLTG